MMDPAHSVQDHRSSGGSLGEGYFEGVVGIKHDGTASMLDTPRDHNSSYSKYPASPSSVPQYRRDVTLASPSHGNNSPTTSYMSAPGKAYSPSALGRDGKPVFAIPFASGQQAQYTYQQGQDGLLGPPMEAVQMEKQGSSDSDRGTWQRW
jgi:hypothetical protein